MKYIFPSLMGAVFVAASAYSAPAPEENLIVNGSFEVGPKVIPGEANVLTPFGGYLPLGPGATVISGWVVTRGPVDLVSSHWRAADGRRSIDLNGTPGIGGIGQTIRTVPGKRYKLTFQLAGHPGSRELKILAVEAGSAKMLFRFSTLGKSPANMGWTEMTVLFVAPGEQTDIEFYSLTLGDGYRGPAIDDVKVVELK